MAKYCYTDGDAASAALAARRDAKADRIRWMLDLPDLTRRPGSPVRHLLERVLEAPTLDGADDVAFPEIVSVERNFDLLNAPPDHPSRSQGDTYYVDETHVLRTQTTSMWGWYLADAPVRARLDTDGQVKAVAYGKVYRNDEIDRAHYPVFHQIDALCVARREHVFGAGRVSHTLRIAYRSFLGTLANEEINAVQAEIREAVVRELGAELR